VDTTGQNSPVTPLGSQLLKVARQVDQLMIHLKLIRPGLLPPAVLDELARISTQVNSIKDQITAVEEQLGRMQALAGIGQVVNSSLDLDVVLRIVMDTIIRLTGAERGFLMLKNDQGELTIRMARNWERESIHASDYAISRTVINQVVADCQPVLTTNAQQDPRFGGTESVVAYNLRSILCVPLVVKSDLIGVLYADNRIRSGIFAQTELDLLLAFANQAAVAIDNARLFASVRRTLDEVTGLKTLMDNVFSSIVSGVITADIQEKVTLCNRAAEIILGQSSPELVGQSLGSVLNPLDPSLILHLRQVIRTNQPVTGLEVAPVLPHRGALDLRFNLSPLKDASQMTQGVTIVMDDLTEKKHLQAQRRLFERMVSPAVIEQLDPDSLHLGGRRSEITVLFADIRGFTSFSEDLDPELLVSILNSHLAAAAEAILWQSGTIDKFLGDAVMAWFNAPIPQADHSLRAVWAALGIRQAILNLHDILPASHHLSFGVGIHFGEAVLGLVGTEKRLEYTAIGDSINTAKRIQENSGPGQVLVSAAVYERVCEYVIARPVEPVLAKGKREPIPVYDIIDLK
jgi:adenylate cyclase